MARDPVRIPEVASHPTAETPAWRQIDLQVYDLQLAAKRPHATLGRGLEPGGPLHSSDRKAPPCPGAFAVEARGGVGIEQG